MSVDVYCDFDLMSLCPMSETFRRVLKNNQDVLVDDCSSEYLLKAMRIAWVRWNVFIHSDLVTQWDTSHTGKRFQNVQSRVKRVAPTRVTCKYKIYLRKSLN